MFNASDEGREKSASEGGFVRGVKLRQEYEKRQMKGHARSAQEEFNGTDTSSMHAAQAECLIGEKTPSLLLCLAHRGPSLDPCPKKRF